jgi:outer membrane protein assembly factor BamA
MLKMINKYYHNSFIKLRVEGVICFLSFIFFLTSCTALKFVPDNKVLYTGYDIQIKPLEKVNHKKQIKEIIDQNITPKPNSSILGMRPKLWFFYMGGENPKKKSLKYFIKYKLGEPPIFVTDVNADKVSKYLKGQLINNGYFKSDVKHELAIKGKKGKIIYNAYVHRPYRLREIDYPKNDTLFAHVDSIRKDTYLKPKQRYNLERLKAEQTRIKQGLENFGYYFFDARDLIFEADSTVGDKRIDLTLGLEEGVRPKNTRPYKVGRVTIFPDYSLSLDSIIRSSDTLHIHGFDYVDREKNYKPYIITKVINLKPGKVYSRKDRDYTISHLMTFGSFKFVEIKFIENAIDSSVIDANIFLTPYLKKSIRADLQATSKSNNFVGPGINVKFTDRNLFRGAERFDLSVTTGYEVQISRKLPQPLNAFELGAEATVSVPRFITPFNIYYPSRKYLPSTDIRLGYRLQQRIGYFRLNSFNTGFGYTWKQNNLKVHELYPIDVSYMRLSNTSLKFDSLVNGNRFLKRSLENQFILGARYSYTLNTQLNQERQNKFRIKQFERSNFYLNAKAETSGNLMHAIMGGNFKSNPEITGEKKIYGSPYAQFVRAEADFRYFYKLNKKKSLATRIIAGTGYAYGNSIVMPYIRQFSVGGSTSLRAFPARSIGPGTYNVRTAANDENQILFLDQRGDVKLEGSVEYRFDITRIIKGALFTDAGNIWLWRADSLRPGGQFKRSQVLNQLAAGTGAGLRFDLNFFVLRFDLAFPIRKPYLPGNKWVWKEIDFGSHLWRKENLILNIAIGYPF